MFLAICSCAESLLQKNKEAPCYTFDGSLLDSTSVATEMLFSASYQEHV